VTTGNGTIASRVSTAAVALTPAVPGDRDWSPRTTGSITTTEMNSIASRFIGETDRITIFALTCPFPFVQNEITRVSSDPCSA
jgi:hypothetical protein